MKIKNEKILIKCGKKRIELRNLILDAYLNQFANAQISIGNAVSTDFQKCLNYCLLKFEEPLNFDKTSKIPNENFDVALIGDELIRQEGNEKKVIIQYDYVFNANSFFYDYKKKYGGQYMSEYYGKKITAIGFNSWWTPTTKEKFIPVCAIVDVSNYNLYLQEGQEFSITRKDIIATDIEFYSPTDKIKYPVHLAPNNIENLYLPELKAYEYWDPVAYPVLYSIGFGNDKINIMEEHIIENDEAFLNAKDNKLYVNNLKIYESISNIFLPQFLPFTGARSNYKYIILKYKIYQRLNDSSGDNTTSKNIDSGYYYQCVMPITEYGQKSVVISYERS